MEETRVERCSTDTLEEALKNKDCQLVDVREGFEYESEKITACHHIPLSSFHENSLKNLDKTKPVYLICKSGSRAALAAEKLKNYGFQKCYVLTGGLTAWRDSGKPIVEGAVKRWGLERQVRFAAGSLMLLGIILSFLIHPYFLGLSIFVSAGLIFSGITDTCGMGLLLGKMPWNHTHKTKKPSCCGMKNQNSSIEGGL